MHSEKAFNVEEANRVKKLVESWLKGQGVDYVNLDFLNSEGLLYNDLDSDRVARKFAEEGVDAIFAPHCNFGAEDAVAKLAKKAAKPLLIWGPQDDAPGPDGSRLRDSQCGLFATSKILSRMGMPFTYVTNCAIGDSVLSRGFGNFMAAASVVKSFTNLRIGQISVRPAAFWSVKVNEAELLERFGIEVTPITLMDLKKMFDRAAAERSDEIGEMVAEIKREIKRIDFGDEPLRRSAALRLAIRSWAEEQGLSAVAAQCWGPMFEAVGIAPCFTFSELTGEGLPTICEADIHGAVTAVMAHAARRWESPIFLADVTIRHPENRNAELFWHCGVFPRSLMREGCEPALCDHYNRKAPIVGAWEIRGGDITITRFDGMKGEYSLLMGHGRGVEGPRTHGTWVWIQFKDWPSWEHKFVHGPYIHHCVGVHGLVAPALFEACRYLPGVTPDPVDPSKEEIETYLRG